MSNENEAPLIFEDLSIVEVSVKIAGEDYILREANGDIAAKYRNAVAACTKIGTGGRLSELQGVGDVEPKLVAWCLFKQTATVGLQAVPEATVRSWPNRIQRALFDRAKKIGHLEEEPLTEEALRAKLKELQEKLDTLLVAKENPGPNA